MTELLEKVFNEVSKLPKGKQDALAAVLLEELTSDALWQQSFKKSATALAQLADEALDEFKSGKTESLDPDKL